MLFNSVTFLIFAAVFFSIWPLTRSLRSRHILILCGSYVFYSFWNSPFVLLLLLSSVVDFWAGIFMYRVSTKRRKNLLLCLSLFYNLGVLFFFKYFDFFMDSTKGILGLMGIKTHLPMIHVILPVGISFYTFVTLSYTIDIWKEEITPEYNFIKYAAFVSYWPHLVAGPILRAKQLLPQLDKRRKINAQIFYQGIFLIVFGFFMKVVIADNLANYVERIYNYHFPVTTGDAWLATYAYAMQIFGDFSGYSNIAIGLALLMGFYIPDNFNAPYAAISFSDFWRRWHISLSQWLRDYLYIPLGGNRKGKVRTYINLMLTMLLGGLWHGAAWNFVVWGGLHGVYLAVERFLGLRPKADHKSTSLRVFMRRLFIFQMVCITWVMFRASFGRGKELLEAMFGAAKHDAVSLYGPEVKIGILLLMLTMLIVQHWFADKNLITAARSVRLSKLGYVVLMGLMILAAIILRGGQGAFIYFQF